MTITSTDEAVMGLLRKVQQKKAEIKALKKTPQWKTNCSIGFDPSQRLSASSGDAKDRINIRIVREAKLVEIYAFLCQKEHYYNQAANELGLSNDEIYMGYTFADWKVDLKSRAEQLSVERKQKEVEELDKRVNKLVTPDQRREMELVALQEILKD